MVVILSIGLTLFWIKKIVACHQLEYHTCQRPDIGTLIIVTAKNNLRRTVFTSLNDIRIMIILITRITHITKLNLNILFSHALNVIMGSRSHLFRSLLLCMQSLLRIDSQKSTFMLFQRVHQHILWVRVLYSFLRRLLKEIILVFERSRTHHRYASLSLHAGYHLVFSLHLLNLFTEFCNNYLSFGFPGLLEQIFLFSLLLIIIFIVVFLIILHDLIRVILLLLSHLFPLLSVFFLLILELLLI